MRKGAKAAIITSVCVVMVGGAGYGAFSFVSAVSDTGTEVKTGPLSADEVKDASSTFFTAWEKGDATKAADTTDDMSGAAADLLTAYRTNAHLTKVRITPGTPKGTSVPFSVNATVSYRGDTEPLTYKSSLRVVRGKATGRPLVAWKPSVIHPDLRADDTLVTGEATSPPIEAVDRKGKVLDPKKYPSLAPVIATLRKRYGDKAGGEPGIELQIRRGDRAAADETLATLSPGTPASCTPRSTRTCRGRPRRRCASTTSPPSSRSSRAAVRCSRSPTTARTSSTRRSRGSSRPAPP